MKFHTFLFCLLLILHYRVSYLQPIFPANGIVFNDEVIPRVDIFIDPDSLHTLVLDENVTEDHIYPADFIWNDGTNKDTINNIGIRLRGNTSRTSAKKSFKLKFNQFGSKKFHGLSDLNLNGEHNDPSVIRSKLNWDLMKLAGIESPRSNHVVLYINGEYFGLYVNVEHIDNDYLQARNKDDLGPLYKCFYGADFTFQGTNPNSYSKLIYHAENLAAEDDYYNLMDFIRSLNDLSNPDYRCNLEQRFDVDNYLKTMAMEILIGHWDNPIYNKNNAYLYFNPDKGKYQLMTYDVDNTYGIDWFGVKWSTLNIYSWARQNDPCPLYKNLMAVPEYKTRFGYYIKKYIQEFFNPGFMNPYIDKIKAKISPYRANDYYAGLDYGYTYNDFNDSYDKALGAHVPIGLKPYIQERSSTALSQLQNTVISPLFENLSFTFNHTAAFISFNLTSLSQPSVKMVYFFDNGTTTEKELADNGIFPDLSAGDGLYSVSIPYTGKTNLNYYITAKDLSGKTSRWPVCDHFSENVGYESTPSLFINEFMADNTTLPDNAGEFEDWIEIYNAGNESVYLGDKFISDKRTVPNKWQLPDMDLAAKNFILIWADEDQDQGPDHANFKLSKSGEFIGIFDAQENNFAPIDTLSFGPQLTDKTSGRYPDGTGPVVVLQSVTPGQSNVITATNEAIAPHISVFPNPADEYFRIFPDDLKGRVTISGLNGNKIADRILDDMASHHINIHQLKPGMYIVSIYDASGGQSFRLIKL